MSRQEQSDGFVALLAVLVLGAVTAAVAILLLATATDSSREILVTQQSVQARNLSTACAEEALGNIQATPGYTGTGSLSLASGNCAYAVTLAAGTYTIDASSSVGNVTRKLRVNATISASSISITSWQEVGT